MGEIIVVCLLSWCISCFVCLYWGKFMLIQSKEKSESRRGVRFFLRRRSALSSTLLLLLHHSEWTWNSVQLFSRRCTQRGLKNLMKLIPEQLSENIDLWFKAMVLRWAWERQKILFKWRQGVDSTRTNKFFSEVLSVLLFRFLICVNSMKVSNWIIFFRPSLASHTSISPRSRWSYLCEWWNHLSQAHETWFPFSLVLVAIYPKNLIIILIHSSPPLSVTR